MTPLESQANPIHLIPFQPASVGAPDVFLENGMSSTHDSEDRRGLSEGRSLEMVQQFKESQKVKRNGVTTPTRLVKT